MPELILLCEGAAPDRSRGAAGDAFDDAASAIRAATQARWLRACFGAGQVVHDRVDDAPLMRESPADGWLRARMAVPESDTVQAYAAFAPEAGARSTRWSLTPANALVGYDHIRLRDPGELALDAAEARELVAAAAPLFAEAGYGLELASPQRWYFTAETAPRVVALPWTMASGRSIEPYLPDGPDARAWRRLVNEVQMHWHEHPANARREEAGRQAVNMLWLNGCASGALPRSLHAIATADPALTGLAHAAGAEVFVPPGHTTTSGHSSGAPSLLARLAEGARAGDVLLDIALWREPRRRGDAAAWAQSWHDLDDWLERLGTAADARAGFERIRIVITGERRRIELCSDGAGWTRLWRRFDPIAAIL